MKKKEALEVALSAIHDQHVLFTGPESSHHKVVLNCDCVYGKSVRRIIRMSDKHKDEFINKLVTMPVQTTSRRRKAAAPVSPQSVEAS